MLLIVGAFGVFAVLSGASDEAPAARGTAPEIAYCSLSLRSSVVIRYAVKSENDDVRLLVWRSATESYEAGSETEVITQFKTETIEGKSYKVFELTTVAAKEMGDVIYARAYSPSSAEKYSEVNKYSVLQYAYNMLGKTAEGTDDAELCEMLAKLLEYGAAAQKYLDDYKVTRLVTMDWYEVRLTSGRLEDGCDHGLYLPGDTVTLTAPEADSDGNVFLYWANGSGEKVGENASFVLTVGTKNEVYTPVYVDPDALAEGVTALSGSFIYEGGILKANEDNSYGVLDLASVNDGEIAVSFLGEGKKTLYFSSEANGLVRGKPASDHYALTLDEYGNIELIREAGGKEAIVGVSLAIKDSYSATERYTFGITKSGKYVKVTYADTVIFEYTDSIPMTGLSLIVACEKSGASVNVDSYSTTDAVIVRDEVVYWSDAAKKGSYTLNIGGKTVENITSCRYDLASLGLGSGKYTGKIIAEGEDELYSFEYGTESEADDLTVYHGAYSKYGDAGYVSTEKNSLALLSGSELLDGTLSANIIPGIHKDNGLIFRASAGGLESFWEDSPAQYYTVVFIENGRIMLGKVNYNGAAWTSLGAADVPSFNANTAYNIKVTLAEGLIRVYVDGARVIDVTDPDPFMHTGFGFRTGIEGSVIENITVKEPEALGFRAEAVNEAVTLGGAVDPSNIKAFIDYDTGKREYLTLTADMISKVDTSVAGERTATVTYTEGSVTFTDTVKLFVGEGQLYYNSFDDCVSALPEGWSRVDFWQTGSSTAVMDGYLELYNGNGNPSAIVYDGPWSDYTVEIKLSVSSAINNGRWAGVTLRNNDGKWWKGSYGVNGDVALNGIDSNTSVGTNWYHVVTDPDYLVNESSGLSVWGVEGSENTVITLRVSVKGSNLVAEVNGKIFSQTLPEGYEKGSFGLAFSGGTYKVHSISVTEPCDDDFVLYEYDFTTAPDSDSMPLGWSQQTGNQTGTVTKVASGSLLLNNPVLNPSAVHYASSWKDYTVEIKFTATNFRWIGITCRYGANGWWKGSLSSNGATAINRVQNTDLVNGANWDHINTVGGNCGLTVNNGTEYTMRLSVRGNQIALAVNGALLTYTIPDSVYSNYETGSFGIAFSGNNASSVYNIKSITVRSAVDSDFTSAN